MAGGEPRATSSCQLRAEAVAHVARPGLQVALAWSTDALNCEPDAEPLAELAAELFIIAGFVAQPVVDVQCSDLLTAAQLDRDVEQADGVAATGEADDDRLAAYQQAASSDPFKQLGCLLLGDYFSPARPARKSSVASLKPLSWTSPMRSNSRCFPAISTTGQVTSTSPAAARAATRAARLTSRPK